MLAGCMYTYRWWESWTCGWVWRGGCRTLPARASPASGRLERLPYTPSRTMSAAGVLTPSRRFWGTAWLGANQGVLGSCPSSVRVDSVVNKCGWCPQGNELGGEYWWILIGDALHLWNMITTTQIWSCCEDCNDQWRILKRVKCLAQWIKK